MIIEATSLKKTYGNMTAVDSLDFSVEPGQCYGFVGPNGAGKTTTMKMIYCIVRPSGGTLNVFGLDVLKHPRQIKARLGVVPQENNLDPDFTTLQNLLVYARYFGIPKKTAARRAEGLLEFMHLAERADAPVAALSGGMKRRLILARALINEPGAIVLDEPTTGLDPQVRHLIWDQLLELKEQGITLLLTTHYMEEAQKLCDRVLIIDQARKIDEGTPGELIRRHLPPYVLELRAGRAEQAGLIAAWPGLEHQESGQSLFFYGQSTADFTGILASQTRTEHIIRPASLEDVFLKLTGREIRQ